MNFDGKAEQSFWAADSENGVTSGHIEALDKDMKLWAPGMAMVTSGRRVLDLGAGKAPLGILLATKYTPAMVVSTDVGLERLRTATSWTRHVRRLSLTCADAFHLPFAADAFDVIYANSFLHHLPNLCDAVGEIMRVLKPGGWYIGREPNFDNPIVRTAVFDFDGTWVRRGARVSANEYPLRAAGIVEAFRSARSDCSLHYFWRRARWLEHPKWSVAISVRATKQGAN